MHTCCVASTWPPRSSLRLWPRSLSRHGICRAPTSCVRGCAWPLLARRNIHHPQGPGHRQDVACLLYYGPTQYICEYLHVPCLLLIMTHSLCWTVHRAGRRRRRRRLKYSYLPFSWMSSVYIAAAAVRWYMQLGHTPIPGVLQVINHVRVMNRGLV
jgi:hypothetical protein